MRATPANVCPVSSITEQYEYRDVAAAIADPDKIVIVSTSPSVRIALGEEFGYEKGSFVAGKMVALLRKLGVTVLRRMLTKKASLNWPNSFAQ